MTVDAEIPTQIVPVHEQHIVALVCHIVVCVCAADRRHLLSLPGTVDVIGCGAQVGMAGRVRAAQLSAAHHCCGGCQPGPGGPYCGGCGCPCGHCPPPANPPGPGPPVNFRGSPRMTRNAGTNMRPAVTATTSPAIRS